MLLWMAGATLSIIPFFGRVLAIVIGGTIVLGGIILITMATSGTERP